MKHRWKRRERITPVIMVGKESPSVGGEDNGGLASTFEAVERDKLITAERTLGNEDEAIGNIHAPLRVVQGTQVDL